MNMVNMNFNSNPAEEESICGQKSSSLTGDLSGMFNKDNTLFYNNMMNRFSSGFISIVNKLKIMLIFMGVN